MPFFGGGSARLCRRAPAQLGSGGIRAPPQAARLRPGVNRSSQHQLFRVSPVCVQNHNNKPIRKPFAQFLSGILAFRAADWLVYTIAVEVFGVYYLLMQFIDIAIFSILKYEFSRRVIEAH